MGPRPGPNVDTEPTLEEDAPGYPRFARANELEQTADRSTHELSQEAVVRRGAHRTVEGDDTRMAQTREDSKFLFKVLEDLLPLLLVVGNEDFLQRDFDATVLGLENAS